MIEELGAALGLSAMAGLNLYLTVFVASLAVRFDWIALADKYQGLEMLGSPWIIGIAGTLFLIEALADKVPWVDSAWDAVHTIIRPLGGAFLGLAVLGDLSPEMEVVAGLLAGGTALSTHLAKAGTRLAINLSPEPVSNAVASVAEDGLVLGGFGLLALAPGIAFFVFLAFVLFAIWLFTRTFRFFRGGWRKLRGGDPGQGAPAA